MFSIRIAAWLHVLNEMLIYVWKHVAVFACEQSESFPERGEKCCVSEQSAHAEMQDKKIAHQCLEKRSGKNNALADV